MAAVVGVGLFVSGLLLGLRLGKKETPPKTEQRTRPTEYKTAEEKITLGSGSIKPMTVKEKQFEKRFGDEAARMRELLK